MRHVIYIMLTLFLLGALNACKGQNRNQDSNPEKKNSSDLVPNNVFIILPSASEIDSLKHLWGEERFYIMADDENARLAEIYNVLDKNKISYKTTQKDCLDSIYKKINKVSFPNVWGVLTTDKNGEFNFKSTVDFLMDIKEKTLAIVSENKTDVAQHWYSNYNGSFLRLESESADPRSQASLTLEVDDNGGVFKLDSYVEVIEVGFTFLEVDKSTLKLTEIKTATEKELQADLGSLYLEKDKYYFHSPYINYLLGKAENNRFRIQLTKRKIPKELKIDTIEQLNFEGQLSLYSDNQIYINFSISEVNDKEEYKIYFKNIVSQNIYYPDKASLIPEPISKTKPIGSFNITQSGAISLNWIGLFND